MFWQHNQFHGFLFRYLREDKIRLETGIPHLNVFLFFLLDFFLDLGGDVFLADLAFEGFQTLDFAFNFDPSLDRLTFRQVRLSEQGER